MLPSGSKCYLETNKYNHPYWLCATSRVQPVWFIDNFQNATYPSSPFSKHMPMFSLWCGKKSGDGLLPTSMLMLTSFSVMHVVSLVICFIQEYVGPF